MILVSMISHVVKTVSIESVLSNVQIDVDLERLESDGPLFSTNSL